MSSSSGISLSSGTEVKLAEKCLSFLEALIELLELRELLRELDDGEHLEDTSG
jgi:hypothetical protein